MCKITSDAHLDFSGFSLSRYVFVGDAVVLKDPNETDKFLVRRLAALEGSEMVSTDVKEEPFVLEKDQCWVVAENKEIKAKVQSLLGML